MERIEEDIEFRCGRCNAERKATKGLVGQCGRDMYVEQSRILVQFSTCGPQGIGIRVYTFFL